MWLFAKIGLIGIIAFYALSALLGAYNGTNVSGSLPFQDKIGQNSSVISTKVNGVGVADAFKSGGIEKAIGASY